jgi:rhodanese-related sulfurtransferase
MSALETMEKIRSVSPEELNTMFDRPDVVVLDVREKKDWEASEEMIESAVAESPEQPEKWLYRYSPACSFVLYCDSPNEETSAEVARKMKANGYERVRVLEGGWKRWKQEDYPTVPK